MGIVLITLKKIFKLLTPISKIVFIFQLKSKFSLYIFVHYLMIFIFIKLYKTIDYWY